VGFLFAKIPRPYTFTAFEGLHILRRLIIFLGDNIKVLSFMNDIQAFLNWYLNPRARMARGLFNVIFFLAFVPVLYFKFIEMSESASHKTQQYAPVMNMLKDGLSGQKSLDSTDLQGFLQNESQKREAVRGLMDEFDLNSVMQGQSVAQSKKKETRFSDFLNILIYLALVPIVMMRWRDLGKWENSLMIYTGLTYSALLLDVLYSVFSVQVAVGLKGACAVVSFVMFSWLCMGGSKKRQRDIVQGDTYMPGDSPDDPY